MIQSEPIFKGDSLYIIVVLDETITSNYKITAKVYDESGNELILKTENNGGAEGEVSILILSSGTFRINIDKNLTTDFDNKTKVQIEVETDETPSRLNTMSIDLPLLCKKTN